jgi:hypothetical protein
MATRRWSAVAALLALVLVSVPAWLRAQAEQRVVYASALDGSGAPAQDLGASDFVVREDRTTREILNVVPAADPIDIALLVDNSQAADLLVRDFRAGLTAFIKAIAADPSGARHQVAVITVGERPTINTDYTRDIDAAVKGANRIFATPGSGTYMLDGIIETSQGLRRREATRAAIVAVVTANGPELSNRVYQAVLEPLRAAGATLHVLVVGSPRTLDQDRQLAFDLGTRDTGGRFETVLTGMALAPRMTQLANELTHQYKITYARPQTLIPPDRVTVGAARQGLTVRGIQARNQPARGER